MKKRPVLKSGYWWATWNPQRPDAPPCLWGKYRADCQADPDEIVIRVKVVAPETKKEP